jgi:hypothetical protein
MQVEEFQPPASIILPFPLQFPHFIFLAILSPPKADWAKKVARGVPGQSILVEFQQSSTGTPLVLHLPQRRTCGAGAPSEDWRIRTSFFELFVDVRRGNQTPKVQKLEANFPPALLVCSARTRPTGETTSSRPSLPRYGTRE